MNNDLKKSIRNAMNKSSNTPTFDASKLNNNHEFNNQELHDQTSLSEKESLDQTSLSEKELRDQTNLSEKELYNNNRLSEDDTITQRASGLSSETQAIRKQNNKKRDKPLKVFGWICIALFAVSMIFDPISSVDASDAAKNALADKISTSLSAGTILLAKDENIGQQDYTITHKYDKSDTKIWVWDYAAEDGDYVQVLVNGTPIGDAFMIKHKPVEITVPAVGDVQIKGIRDGGGGITYAVRYDLNGTNYFNSAPEGEFNTYTLIKE